MGQPRLLGGEILMIGYLGGVKAVPFQILDELAHKNLKGISNYIENKSVSVSVNNLLN